MAAREHVHLIGIGGTGMSALAGLLHDSGCRVTGSDRALYPPTSTLLHDMGLTVHIGFDAANLQPSPDLVVVGNAVRRGNPEAEHVLDHDLPYCSMPQLIGRRFLHGRHPIVVAGTHGKTTTTAMLAWVLHSAGRDPGFLIGGLPRDFDRPFRIGTGPAFVIEGDEYDSAFFDKGPKFMHYRPRTALIGTVEFDHADIFRDLDHVKTAFRWLTNTVPRAGLIVRHEDCAITREVTSAALSRVTGYGRDDGAWRVEQVRHDDHGAWFRIMLDGQEWGQARMVMPGDHNVSNALAVTAAAAEQGLTRDEILHGLATFRGVKRRMEVRGEVGGVVVLDDFAHHPTAIASTLRTVRSLYPGRTVWAAFEPRSWSMRRDVFQDRLPEALGEADRVVLSQVYGSDEVDPDHRLDPDRLVRDLEAIGRPARFLPDADAIAGFVAGAARPGDVVVIMSNGGFGGLHEKLLAGLEAAAESR